MKFTEEQLKKIYLAKNADELIALAKAEGIDMSEDEIRTRFESLHKEGEISDEELKNAAGGGLCDPEPEIFTKMICKNCGAHTFWRGDYVNGVLYKCPMCSAEAYYGEYTTDSTGW